MKYRAITSENFYFKEMKNVCRYLNKNSNLEDIKEVFLEEDTLDTTSEHNFNKKFLTVNKRMKYLSKFLVEHYIYGTIEIAKFINFFTILNTERILLEFMDEVIKEKYISYDYILKESDFRKYIEYKSEQSEIVNNWSDATKKKIIVKIKNFLTEGGYLRKNDDEYSIIRPIILPEIIEELKSNGGEKIVEAMLY